MNKPFMATGRWPYFWIVWCTAFFVWDVTFAFIDPGWWKVYFLFWATIQLFIGIFWWNRRP